KDKKLKYRGRIVYMEKVINQKKNKTNASYKKRFIGIIIFFLLFLISAFAQPLGTMDEYAFKSIFILIIAITLFILEPIPVGASAILVLILPTILGISTFRDTLFSFSNPSLLFVVATFGLSAAITKVPLSKRILLFLLKHMGDSVEKLILSIMI